MENKRVIVVGNSPVLKDKNLGKKIDEYDLIIRCNFCDTKGFEKSHGSRTSIWVTSFTEVHYLEFGGPDVLEKKEIWFRTKNDYHSVNVGFLKNKYPDLEENYKFSTLAGSSCGIHDLNDDIQGVISSDIRDQIPLTCEDFVISTGLAAILNAIRAYGKVDIAGFTFYCENDDVNRLFGYNGPTPNENLSKHANNTKIIINYLEHMGKLSYINGEEKNILRNF